VHITGVEPAQSYDYKPLKPARLPIPPYVQCIETKKAKQCLTFISDRAGARTQDPLLKREMLYQLSYQVLLIKSECKYTTYCLKNKTNFR
jgi:hypothetical protein